MRTRGEICGLAPFCNCSEGLERDLTSDLARGWILAMSDTVSSLQRRADHEAGHYIVAKLFEDKGQYKLISFKLTIETNSYFDFNTLPPMNQFYYILCLLGGICGESLGLHMRKLDSFDDGLDPSKLSEALPSLIDNAIGFVTAGVSGTNDVAEIKNAIERINSKEAAEKWSLEENRPMVGAILHAINAVWRGLLQVSDALMVHTIITHENFDEHVLGKESK